MGGFSLTVAATVVYFFQRSLFHVFHNPRRWFPLHEDDTGPDGWWKIIPAESWPGVSHLAQTVPGLIRIMNSRKMGFNGIFMFRN